MNKKWIFKNVFTFCFLICGTVDAQIPTYTYICFRPTYHGIDIGGKVDETLVFPKLHTRWYFGTPFSIQWANLFIEKETNLNFERPLHVNLKAYKNNHDLGTIGEPIVLKYQFEAEKSNLRLRTQPSIYFSKRM